MSTGFQQKHGSTDESQDQDIADPQSSEVSCECVLLFGFDLFECEIIVCYKFDEKLAS